MLDKMAIIAYNSIKDRREENKTMTKVQMVNVIEESGMVINFSRSYFMGLLKSKVERFYNDALAFMAKNN